MSLFACRGEHIDRARIEGIHLAIVHADLPFPVADDEQHRTDHPIARPLQACLADKVQGMQPLKRTEPVFIPEDSEEHLIADSRVENAPHQRGEARTSQLRWQWRKLEPTITVLLKLSNQCNKLVSRHPPSSSPYRSAKCGQYDRSFPFLNRADRSLSSRTAFPPVAVLPFPFSHAAHGPVAG